MGKAPWLTLVAALLGWLFDGFEMGLFPVVARPALRDLLGEVPDRVIAGHIANITAAFLVGAAAGGFLFGWLGDRLGRVRALSLSILTYSLFTGLGWFAQTPAHFAGLRFLAALGMGGEWSLGVALIMECWPERHRPWLAGVIGAAANVGYMLVAAIGLLKEVRVDSWRWMFLVGSAPALLVFLVRLAVPESEPWRRATAQGATRPIRELLAGGLLARTLLAVALASIPLIGTWAVNQWAVPAWVDRMTGGTQPKAKSTVALLWAFGATTGSLLAPIAGARFDRRTVYFWLALLSLASTSFLFRALDTYAAPLKVTVFVCGAVTAAFYGWLPLYLPELFPTRVRATGQGLAFNLGRILAAIGAVQGGRLVAFFDNDYPKAGATMAWVYALGLVLIWFGPETKGRPLPA